MPFSGVLATISEEAVATAMLLANGAVGATSGPAADPVTGRGDIDRDGSLEVVVVGYMGRNSVFDRFGRMLPGFPVRSNPAYSQPQRADREAGYYAANPAFVPGDFPGGALPNNPDWVPDLVNRKNKINSTTWSFLAAPTLGNIDPSDDALEIVAGAMDRHLYAFKSNGAPVPGWPVMLRDPAKVGSVDPLTHRVTNAPGINNRRGAMIVASPAVGDIDNDGDLNVAAAVNEQYEEPINTDDFILPQVLAALDEHGGNNRVYVVHGDGALHGGGPGNASGGHPNANAYRAGWPAKVGTLVLELLPVVSEGPNSPPVLADINNDGALELAVFGTAGPAYVFEPDGVSAYGRSSDGFDRTLLMEPFGAGSNSIDTQSIPAVGGGIFSQFLPCSPPVYATGAAGLGKFLDVVLPEDQILSDNHFSVWDTSGTRL